MTILNNKFKTKFSVSPEKRDIFLTKIVKDGAEYYTIVDPIQPLEDHMKKYYDYKKAKEKDYYTDISMPGFDVTGILSVYPVYVNDPKKSLNKDSIISYAVTNHTSTYFHYDGYIESDFPLISIGSYDVNTSGKVKTNINMQNINPDFNLFFYAPITRFKNVLSNCSFIIVLNEVQRNDESYIYAINPFQYQENSFLNTLLNYLFLGELSLLQDLIFSIEYKTIEKKYYDYEDNNFNENDYTIYYNAKSNYNNFFTNDQYTEPKKAKIDLEVFTGFHYYLHPSKHYRKYISTNHAYVMSRILSQLGVEKIHGQELYLILGNSSEIIKYFDDVNKVKEYVGINYYNGYYYKAIKQNKEILLIVEKEITNTEELESLGQTSFTCYEYTQSFSFETYLANSELELIENAIINIDKKIQTDKLNYFVQKYNKQNIINLLTANKEVILIREDSYAVGNCKTGTENFIKQFNLDEIEVITCETILNHKYLHGMLNNHEFVRVLLNKLKNETLV